MGLDIQEVAEAFSRHDFEATYPHLAGDVRWDPVGGELLAGREHVIGACRASTAYLQNVQTTFRRFRTVVGQDTVVVDSLAEYADEAGDVSLVASCDLYDFASGKLAAITSYTVEVGA